MKLKIIQYTEITKENRVLAKKLQYIEDQITRQNYQEGLFALKETLQRYPDNQIAWTLLARLSDMFAKHYWGMAITIPVYQEVAKRYPRNFHALANLGEALFCAREYNKAIEALEKASNLRPEDNDLQIDLAIACYEHRHHEPTK